MKKILFAVLICLSCSYIYAQSDKKLKKQIDDLTEKKAELEIELNRINTEIAQIENRSFSRETPDQGLRKKLAWFDDVKSLANDVNVQQRLRNSQLGNTYSLITKMYLTLLKDGGYKKEDNDFYNNQVNAIKHQLSLMEPAHKESFMQSFEELSSLIKDYRFTMFELIRVFDLVDEREGNGMEKAKIYSSLKADEETEFIDKIPYTQFLLRNYINSNPIYRKKIRENDAFKTIK